MTSLECFLISVGIGFNIGANASDTPQSIAFEDCGGKTKVTEIKSNKPLTIIRYEKDTGFYYYKIKEGRQ